MNLITRIYHLLYNNCSIIYSTSLSLLTIFVNQTVNTLGGDLDTAMQEHNVICSKISLGYSTYENTIIQRRLGQVTW